MKKFKLGDIVRLRKDSKFWGQSGDEKGVIVEFTHNYETVDTPNPHVLYILVKWKDGSKYSYREQDLDNISSSFDVGDTVVLRKASPYTYQSDGEYGIIIDITSSTDHIYQIKWRNGYVDCYRPIDLVLIQKHQSLVDRYIVVYDNEEEQEAYFQVVEDNTVYDENGCRFVKVIGVSFECRVYNNPVNVMMDDNKERTYGFMTPERIIWLNHILQTGEYVDYDEFISSMSEINKLKLECLKRYPHLKIGEKFGFTNYHDSIVKELHPRNWTVNNIEIFLAKFGQCGSLVYQKGKWAERTPSITSVSVAHPDDIEFPTNPEIIIPLLNRKSTIKQLKL